MRQGLQAEYDKSEHQDFPGDISKNDNFVASCHAVALHIDGFVTLYLSFPSL